MKKSMDLFGDVLLAYSKGDRTPFYFISQDYKSENNVSRYFRMPSELKKIENKMISLCYGNILDIGCGTANYFPKLTKKGKVLGIDISSKIIAIAKNSGHNCIVANIFTLKSFVKYDTITLFENNIGMAGSISRTKLLLKKIFSLLKKNGQLLLILRNAKDKDYVQVKLTPVWKNIRGEEFNWMVYNKDYLKKMCEALGLNAEILMSEDNNYLMRVKRK
jgi:SAM-dependent methyltransferase